MKRASVLTVLLLLSSAGCTLPREGPTTADVMGATGTEQEKPLFSLIKMDTRVVGVLAGEAPTGEREGERRLPRPGPVGLLGPGDLLRVSVWETLIGDTASGVIDKPTITVLSRIEPSGGITLPFVGRVRAAGRSPSQIEQTLVGYLRAQFINPQVSVLVEEDQTNTVVLAGEVGSPGRQSLPHAALRLLDLLALAGGPRIPADKAVVRVERGGTVWSHPLARILADPDLNVRLAPGDRITVLPLNRRFYAFGAVNRPGEHEFPAETQSLIQALGRVAGLQDGRADPTGVFLFRKQDAALTSAMVEGTDTPLSTVVYQLDMKDPSAFFLASAFQIRPEDVLFVSNAPIADLAKVLNLITQVGSVAAVPRNLGATP